MLKGGRFRIGSKSFAGWAKEFLFRCHLSLRAFGIALYIHIVFQGGGGGDFEKCQPLLAAQCDASRCLLFEHIKGKR